ncbi:MAG: DUF927 domain-containing protein [Chromatiaceae bacterium]|nr:DUF927 domain-containing protein [Chromatiaceae bacterium]
MSKTTIKDKSAVGRLAPVHYIEEHTSAPRGSGPAESGASNGTAVAVLPWGDVVEFIPKGFRLCLDGVYTDRDDPELICGPCWIAALSRTKQGEEWGLEIRWIDQDGKQRQLNVPGAVLFERASSLPGLLYSMGLKVVPGMEKRLITYLGSFDLPESFRRRAVSRLGWTEAPDGSPLFVLPQTVIGDGLGEPVVFQPEEHSPTVRSMTTRGSLKQWQHHVALPCVGNPVLVFSLSASFAGPLLKLAGLECGGFHLYGSTSRGKTTALQVAATPWGCGADPAESGDSHVSRWNTTANALEATAAAHNDGLLALDELGTCDARDIGKVVYDLFGGKGKRRLTKSSALQPQRAWHILSLSTGEVPVQQKIEEQGGKVRGGHLVRLADVPVANGVVVDPHGQDPGEFVTGLKRRCGEYFGTAGPAFLERLIAGLPTLGDLSEAVKRDLAVEEAELVGRLGRSGLSAESRRVLRRFALVSVAGGYAVALGVLPFTCEEVTNAVAEVARAWLGDESNLPEGVRGVAMIRATIMESISQFQDASATEPTVRGKVIGYHDRMRGVFLFDKDQLAKICRGLRLDAVADELDRMGLLYRNEADRKTSRVPVAMLKTRPRFYSVFERITDATE